MVTMSNCPSANGVRAPSWTASAGAGPKAAGQRFATSASMPVETSQPVKAARAPSAGQHAHEVARAAAIVEHGEAAPGQFGFMAQQPARFDGDELVGRGAHQALDRVVETAVVGRGVAVELGRLHFGPPTISRIMNSGRPLLWS